MSLYYIEERFYQTHTAGSKPRNDFNTFLKKLGCHSIQELLQSPGATLRMDDLVFIQYTFTHLWKEQMFHFCSSHNIKTVLFINDISCLHDGDDSKLEPEIRLFNEADFLIVHNEKMKGWLREHGVKSEMIVLGLFDYIVDPFIYETIPDRQFSHDVVFAGNLNPILRRFLYDPSYLHEYQLNLYGPEVYGTLQSHHTTYFGSFCPEEIPAKLQGSFGLLWNGESQETCTGHVSYYSTIATPHKLSLYLLAKLPLICWEQASEASFIIENNLGFTISSLSEIEHKLELITEEDYRQMVKRVEDYSKRLYSCYYFKQAINQILKKLQMSESSRDE